MTFPINQTTPEAALENGRDDVQGLRRAAQSFESLFFNELFKAMRKTVPDTAASTGQSMFTSMLDEQLSEQICQTGGLGLSDVLVQQFGQQTPQVSPQKDDATPVAGHRAPHVEASKP